MAFLNSEEISKLGLKSYGENNKISDTKCLHSSKIFLFYTKQIHLKTMLQVYINRLTSNSNYFTVVGILLLTSSLVLSYLKIYYGIDFTDSYFYINKANHIKDYPLWIGTSYIAAFIKNTFGHSLIIFRHFNWIAYVLAMFIPFFGLIPSNKIKKNLHWLSFSIIFLSVLNTNIFGIDSLTFLFLSLNATIAIIVIRKQNISMVILHGITTSLLILVRFPNIIYVPIFIFIQFAPLLLIKNNSPTFKKIVVNSLVYLFSASFFFLLFWYSTYQNLNIISTINIYLSTLNNNSTYSLFILIGKYLHGYSNLIKYIGFVTVIALCLNYGKKLLKKTRYLWYAFILMSYFIVLKYDLLFDSYTRHYSSFISAISIVSICYLIVENFKTTNYKTLQLMFLIVLVAVVPIAGSNTGLLKLAPFLLCMLPFLLSQIKLPSIIKSFFILTSLFALYLNYITVYEDASLMYLTKQSNHTYLKGIRTTPSKAKHINDVVENYNTLKKESNLNIIFWGKDSHLFHYLTGTSTGYNNSFWMNPNDKEEINRLESTITKLPTIIILPTKTEINKDNYLSTMLEKHNYSNIIKDNFEVYIPSSPTIPTI